MPNQRKPGKRLLGAQVAPELLRGIDRWRARHAPATLTDFLVLACLEKLEREGIAVDRVEALRDYRARRPLAPAAGRGRAWAGARAGGGEGSRANSTPDEAAQVLARRAVAAVERPGVVFGPRRKAASPSDRTSAPTGRAGRR
jgi:hypothetical protein